MVQEYKNIQKTKKFYDIKKLKYGNFTIETIKYLKTMDNINLLGICFLLNYIENINIQKNTDFYNNFLKIYQYIKYSRSNFYTYYKEYVNFESDINNLMYNILINGNNFSNIKTRILGLDNKSKYRYTMVMKIYNSGICYYKNNNRNRKSCYNLIIYDINNIIIYVSTPESIYSHENFENTIKNIYKKSKKDIISLISYSDKIYVNLSIESIDGIYFKNEENELERKINLKQTNIIQEEEIFRNINKMCPNLFMDKYSSYKKNYKYLDKIQYSRLLIICTLYNISFLLEKKYITVKYFTKKLIKIFRETYNKEALDISNDIVDFKQDIIKMEIMLENIKKMRKIVRSKN
jgi:hypothetical protein